MHRLFYITAEHKVKCFRVFGIYAMAYLKFNQWQKHSESHRIDFTNIAHPSLNW